MIINTTIDNRFSFKPQLVSVDFDGSFETLRNIQDNPLNIENAWTAALWIKPQSIVSNSTLLHWRPDTGGNLIQFRSRGAASSGRIRWDNAQSSGTALKTFEWNSVLVQDAWEFHVATWDGTDLVAYKDGSDLGAPDQTLFDNSGTMDDSPDRRVAFATGISGADAMFCRLHSSMMWSEALSSDAISTVFNSGDGSNFNPRADSGNYASSASLQHWWRFGNDSTDIGGDTGIASPLIDVFVDSINITAGDDIVADSPV